MQALESFIGLIRSVDPTYDTATISDLTIAVQILDELLDTHPKTIAKKIDQLLQLQTYLLQQVAQSQLLEIAHLYDFIVGVVTKYPKLITTRKIRCQKILRGAIQILSRIEDSLTQEWMNPADGMSEDDLYSADADLQVARQIMSSFDALVHLLGQKSQLTQFQKIFREYIERGDDWRIRYAALMIASQLGQDLLEIDQLTIYAEWAITMLGHSHPKVKYAALQLLGQYSNDAKPEFQQKYFDTLTPILIQMLHDPIPRIVSHDIACITNLFEGYGQTGKIQNYIGEILPPIFAYLISGSSWLKQSCLSVLAAISSVKNAFGPNLPQVFESVNSLLSTYTSLPFHRQLLNQCFQTMSFLLTCQSKDYIHQCVPLFAQALVLNRDKIDISYFMGIWMRSCEEAMFVQVADVELVYKYILDRIDSIFKEQGDDDSLLAINCLIKTAKVFKLRVRSFCGPTLILAKAVLNNKQLSNEIRQEAVNLMTAFIESIQSYVPQQYNIWLLTSTQTFQYLLCCVDNVFLNQLDSFQTIEWLLSGVKQLIVELHTAMSFQQITQFVEKLAGYQRQIEKCYTTQLLKKAQIQNEEYDEELGEEDTPNKIIEIDIDCLVNGLEAIPIIFSELLKTNNQEVKQWLMGHLITQIDFFITNKIVDWKHYGLSIIITLIEACNSGELAAYWSSLMLMLVACSSDPNPRIRNQGAYGMGEMFTKTPIESIRDEDVIGWMHQLWSALTTPYADSEHLKKEIKHSEDNVISALGKLLKKCGPAFSHILDENIYRKWASYLPLNNDKLEGNQQQLFLIDILDSAPTLLVKNGNDLKSVCEIYAKFISRRSEKEQAQAIRLTKQSLFRIKGWPIFTEFSNFLWSSLSPTHISALTRLMNS